ncbi:MAG: ferritin family protein [Candidatus Eisenbacteria bacterium]
MNKTQLQTAIDAVRTAIVTEIKGLELYQTAAGKAEDPEVRSMFEMLAEEERHHKAYLEGHYRSLIESGAWAKTELTVPDREKVEEFILDDSFRRSIRRGTFEMAVIAIAVDLEARAVQFYRSMAETADDEETRGVFQQLVSWEEGHHRQFLAMEKEARDAYFSDQRFSPM